MQHYTCVSSLPTSLYKGESMLKGTEMLCFEALRVCLITGYLSANLPLKDQIKFRVISKAALYSKHLSASLSVLNLLITAP